MLREERKAEGQEKDGTGNNGKEPIGSRRQQYKGGEAALSVTNELRGRRGGGGRCYCDGCIGRVPHSEESR